MISILKRLRSDRRGNALVIFGAALPLVIGSAGFATDTIQWSMWKRQMQRAADSAALAGVYAKRMNQTVSSGACSAAAPIARDMTVGTVSTRLGVTPTCVVESPPTSGTYAAASFNAVKVTISAQRPLPFSGMFMTAAPVITASATAAVLQQGRYCAKALDPSVTTGVGFSGNATVNLGCGIIANARGPDAISGGGSSSITASPVASVGQISTGTNFASGTTFQPYSAPTTDPYASVAAPTVPNGCNQQALQGNQHNVVVNNQTKCFTSLKMTSGDTASFTDSIIILNGGDLEVGAGASLNCTRCTIVLTTDASPVTSGSVGKITINGGATINLIAPTSGTYEGIAIYKDRRAPYCDNCNKINGNSSSLIQGAIYIPTQELQFNGNGGINTNCVQLVGWHLTFTGNTTITNVCPGGPGGWDGTMVRLVA